MNLELTNKIAIVTGSSRGLGFASARALLLEGCRVCICARGKKRLNEAAEELREQAGSYERVITVNTDLRQTEGVQAVIQETVDHFGGLDILINSVGKAGGGDLLETSDEDWASAFDQTLYPAIRASRLAVPHMQKQGGGVILIIASIWGRESGGRMTYNAVKAAEISLAKALAQQLAPKNIRVNSVAPGSILFPGGSWHRRQQSDPEGMATFVSQNLPFGRFGAADEVGTVVAFLASPRASWVSGASITVDGCQSRSLF